MRLEAGKYGKLFEIVFSCSRQLLLVNGDVVDMIS